jgi:inositol hexakisphosphate/diphosphoinositol-pentakisphosphate kinase
LIRVKLPKSFLAVNLSESHTFHKKEEQEEEPKGPITVDSVETRQMKADHKDVEPHNNSLDGSLDTTT